MLVVAYIVMYIDIQFAKTLTGIQNMFFVSIFMGMLIVLVSVNIYVFLTYPGLKLKPSKHF